MDGAFHTTLLIVNPDDITERENITYGHMREKKMSWYTATVKTSLFSLNNLVWRFLSSQCAVH